MTTSYKLDAIKELKAQKKLARAQEATDLKMAREEADKRDQENQARIAKKMARIEAGLPVEDPVEKKPVEKKETVKKTVTKKTSKPVAQKKAPAKKRGRPKKSK